MVYIGSIPTSLQRKRTITVGQQDEDHEKARDPDARSMPCSTVGAGDRLVVALFPFAAIGGGLAVGTTAGGAPLGAVAGRAAAGIAVTSGGEVWRAAGCGSGGLGCGRGLRSRRYPLSRAHDTTPGARTRRLDGAWSPPSERRRYRRR